MIEFIVDNKEWIFSGVGVFVLGLFITLCISIRRAKEKRERRIERFVDEFRKLSKNSGVKLEILIPAGISNMKDEKETELAFEALMKVIPNHPLRKWKIRIEKIGYIRFFSHVRNSGKILDSESIETFLSEVD